MSWPEGPTFVRDVLLDEELIPFHVVIDAFHSEMVEVADYVLPDATFLEKWDLDARNSYELRYYVGLRQPVVKPPGECKDIRDILISLAKAIDEDMARYFAFDDAEHFIREWAEAVPGGLEYLKKAGVWVDERQAAAYTPYLQKTDYSILDPRVKIDESGIASIVENNQVIGRLWNGQIVKGFSTKDRRFQFKLPQINELLNSNNPIAPVYRPIQLHQGLNDYEYILTTFKWNVHTQSRTANQTWLTEIVGDNPCWIHPKTAELYGIKNGTEFKISARGRDVEFFHYILVKPVITEAIHPRVLAISASFGHWQYGRTAKGKGYNPNPLIPSWMDPVGGGQAWNDTVVKIECSAG